MVGIFSRLSNSRNGHRRSQSALDGREALPPYPEMGPSSTTIDDLYGVELDVELKPMERPIEPLDTDKPVRCPLPEPSILNDGRIWKARLSASVRRGDLAVMRPKEPSPESERNEQKERPALGRRLLPSMSAPEHRILKYLEDCNATGA